jgi:hypothetical protein
LTSNLSEPVRDLLAAVLEALDIPAPATVGDTDAHHALLADRAMDAVVALQCVLQARGDCAEWSADYLRTQLAAKPPTTYWHWQDRTVQGAAEEEQLPASRCPAAHPQDPTPCGGPIVVVVIDTANVGANGCEHHAARLLASLEGGRVYAYGTSPEGCAIRVFKAAAVTQPFAWVKRGERA